MNLNLVFNMLPCDVLHSLYHNEST